MGHEKDRPARSQAQEERIAHLEQSLARDRAALREKDERIERLEQALEELTGSVAWRLAQPISRIGRRIAPPETRRWHYLRFVLRGLRAAFEIHRTAAQVLDHAQTESEASASPESKPDLHFDQDPSQESRRVRLDPDSGPSQGSPHFIHFPGAASFFRGRVLVIDHRLPTPDRDGGSLRMMEIMREFLRKGLHVTLLPDNMLVFEPYLEDLEKIGIDVVYPPDYLTAADYLERRGRDLDLVIIARADIADRHMPDVRRFAPQAKVVFDTVDLHFVRESRQAQIIEDPELHAAVANRKEQELRLARSADLTVVVSPIEKAMLEAECDNQIDVRIVPTIFPAAEVNPPGFEKRRDIVFIGGFDHAPNTDAVLYFAREIFPRILERIPDVVFQVIGPDPTPEIRWLASPSIDILGLVPDVRPIFDRARVSVAPLRFGAGVKAKVHQSMSLGVPTVVTAIAAEGMYLVHERNAMIADDPESFADAVVRLWTSRELWETVSTNGLENLREHFSVETAAKSIDELLLWAGLPLPNRSGPPSVRLASSFS